MAESKVCFCGCGGATKSKFVPGHDAKFHSIVKGVWRQTHDLDAELSKLPHDEARAAFLAYSDKIEESEVLRAKKLEEGRKPKEVAAPPVEEAKVEEPVLAA